MPIHTIFALPSAAFALLFWIVIATAPSDAGDWATWRGPNVNGIAATGQTPPVAWSDSNNVIWKTPVPGRGHSSPTIVGNQIFLTTADEQTQTQGVLAFDRATGKQLWTTPISKGGFPETHRKNTHATPSVACDGERLFVSFHHHSNIQVSALSLDGKVLWQRTVGVHVVIPVQPIIAIEEHLIAISDYVGSHIHELPWLRLGALVRYPGKI